MEYSASIRKRLNHQQTQLRVELTNPNAGEQAFTLFFLHHPQLHSARLANKTQVVLPQWSYEDYILDDLPPEQYRKLPGNSEHSIAWLIWHLARIEDVAMNLLIAGENQVLNQENWVQRLEVEFKHTGNGMTLVETKALSETINIRALRAYRLAVGHKTEIIVSNLTSQRLREKVDPLRIQRVKDEGALIPAAFGIAEYWSRRTIAGLLLMPATRHNLIHLNEAYHLKKKIS